MRVVLQAGERAVNIGDGGSYGINLTDEGFAGWYGTPSGKWNLTEREAGDGAHAISVPEILYSARTVTIPVRFEGASAADALEYANQLMALAHQHVEITVEDDNASTRAYGVLEVEIDLERMYHRIPATITVVCANPYRYGVTHRGYITNTGSSATGGLLFDETNSYILYPIQFANPQEAGNTATVENDGTSTAYPVITVSGTYNGGILLAGDWGELSYESAIGPGGPLVIDCRTRTATVNGVDVTRSLGSRDFPTVAPGASLTIAATATGTGTITVESSDTFI